ncbi:unnamed protein product [Linum tenue]|uniref:Uncharacterized protein n=1 Tax=Linum tenue TaxID=586396 RepID=A0AAV0GXR0_9ROSI|nr:unnamed protein product [Linum tenue]
MKAPLIIPNIISERPILRNMVSSKNTIAGWKLVVAVAVMIVFVLLSSPPAKASRVLLEVGVVKPDGCKSS